MTRPCVLVVDDEFDIRTTLELLLALEGYEVRLAGNGEDGLASARKERPDIVITDLMMPGMDGLEMCGQLRGDGVLRATPIIMCSASTPPDPGQGKVFDVFMRKPVAFEALLVQIDRLISRQPGQPEGSPPAPPR